MSATDHLWDTIEAQNMEIIRLEQEVDRLKGVVRQILDELTDEIELRKAMYKEAGVEDDD